MARYGKGPADDALERALAKLGAGPKEDDPGDGSDAKPLVAAMEDFIDAVQSGDAEAAATAFSAASQIVDLDSEDGE